jgi:hypothetical protein
VKSCTFVVGDEDLSVDITDWMLSWVDGANPETHYGIMIKFSDTEETSGLTNEYTKKFFARLSQYFYKRPVLEMLYEDGVSTDNDGNRKDFILNSVLYNTPTNYLYYHNKPRGFLEDVPGYVADDGEGDPEPQLLVNIYDEDDNEIISDLTAVWVSTGVYRVAVNIPEGYLFATAYDRWFREEDVVNPIFTGTITIHCPNGGSAEVIETTKTKLSIRELKPFYLNEEIVKFKIDAVDLHWNPNIYVSYYNDGRNQKEKLSNTYYKIVRKIDNLVVVDYSCLSDTGVNYSKLYYNENYNYFTFYCDMLEAGYMYEIRFMSVINGEYWEHPEAFKFRIEDHKKFRF